MIWTRVSLLAGAALAGLALGVGADMRHAWSASPDYVGAQLDFAYPGNTHNNDNHEASSELMVAGQAFAGWELAPWVAIQANLTLMRQFLHGYNHGTVRESDKGDRWAIAAMACPVFRVPGLIVTPYVSGCIGPAYERIRGGPSSVTGTRTDKHNLELALRGAFGVERRVYGPWSIRLEGSYMRVGATDAMDQLGAGAAVIYSFEQD
jgi:opacity protein-like surface antigen